MVRYRAGNVQRLAKELALRLAEPSPAHTLALWWSWEYYEEEEEEVALHPDFVHIYEVVAQPHLVHVVLNLLGVQRARTPA